MALDFNILGLEFDKKHRVYHTEIEFSGTRTKYDIRCINGRIYYVGWIPKPGIMICDSEDRVATNGEVEIIVSGADKKSSRKLEKALTDFMHNQHII